MRAAPFRCKCTWVTAFANGAFVPVSHRLSRFTTMRAHLWRHRAANDAEHLAFALAAARPDAATPFAPHDRTLPANAAEIRLPIASEPHHRAHAATATTRSNWPLVTVWAPRPALTIAAERKRATRP